MVGRAASNWTWALVNDAAAVDYMADGVAGDAGDADGRRVLAPIDQAAPRLPGARLGLGDGFGAILITAAAEGVAGGCSDGRQGGLELVVDGR